MRPTRGVPLFGAWRSIPLVVAGAFAFAFLSGSCGTSSVPTPGVAPTPSSAEFAQFRFIHASPDLAPVDVYVEGSTRPVFTNVPYGSTTAFQRVDASGVTVQIRPAGAAASSEPLATSPPVQVTKSSKVDAIAAGVLGTTDPASSLRVLALLEGFTTPATGTVRLRFVHGSRDVETVGLDLGNDGSVEVTGLARFEATGAEGVEFPAGSRVKVGLVSGNAPLAVLTVPGLPAGTEALAVFTGSPEPPSTGSVVLLISGVGLQPPNEVLGVVYVLHASPDMPSVDVFVGSEKLADDVPYGHLARLFVRSAGSVLTLRSHEDGSLALAGFPTGAAPRGLPSLFIVEGVYPDRLALPVTVSPTAHPGKARIEVFNASVGWTGVNLGVVSGGTFHALPGLTELGFGEQPGRTIMLDPQSLTFGIARAGAGVSEGFLDFDATLPDGLDSIVVISGSPLGYWRHHGVQLLLVDTSAQPWTVTPASPGAQSAPVVYLLHLSPDIPTIDVVDESEERVDGVAFGQLARLVSRPIRSFTFSSSATMSTAP